ncbi:hypothetical protein ACOME3_003017 [Neoechinorhynchus agilis]
MDGSEPRRNVRFGDIKTTKKEPGKSRHTLDSDEDDDPEMEMRSETIKEIGGQEPDPSNDDVRIAGSRLTAFNMDEELEDGFFDVNGCYQWRKQKNEESDAWLDNVDWGDIPTLTKDDADNEHANITDRAALCKGLLPFLKGDTETISECIRRLGGRAKGSMSKKDDPERDISALEKVTGAADELMCDGLYDIYEWNAERLRSEMNKIRQTKL